MQEPNWPPESPKDALLSSPRGRRNYQHLKQARSSPAVTLSPSRVQRAVPPTGVKVLRMHNSDGEEEEDEETLQLKLQAIKAQLKLKKLQREKDKLAKTADVAQEGASSITSEITQHGARSNDARDRVVESAPIHVPLSPAKRPIPFIREPRSPGRNLLGIDKGWSGKDASLRRPFHQGKRTGESLATAGKDSIITSGNGRGLAAAAMSFNERMAARRQDERQALQKKETRRVLQQQRSTGFAVNRTELQDLKRNLELRESNTNGYDRPLADVQAHAQPKVFSRHEIVARASNMNYSESRILQDTNSRNGAEAVVPRKGAVKSSEERNVSQVPQSADASTPPDIATFEPISCTSLSKRLLPQDVLTKQLRDKNIVDIKTLLRHVQKPDWEIPESIVALDADFVVFGIVGRKSAPLDHKASHKPPDHAIMADKTAQAEADESRQNDQKKFMVMTIVAPDLRWSVDMYLFSSAYTRWRMITKGTLIAVLNPGIMPPPPGKLDMNVWSFKLTSEDDSILEVGRSRDLSWCQATQRNGEPCDQWIDGRRLKYCEWHMSRGIANVKKGRMETQSMGLGYKRSAQEGEFRGHRFNKRPRGPGASRDGEDAPTAYHVSEFGFKRDNAASLLDSEDMLRDRGTGGAEKMRRLLAEREKEDGLASRLGMTGHGAGAEYMRSRRTRGGKSEDVARGATSSSNDAHDGKGTGGLGLFKPRGTEIHLSPLKRRANRSNGRADDDLALLGANAPSAEAQVNDESDDLEII